MSFNESNTVEQMILDAVESLGRTTAVEPMHEPGAGGSLGAEFKPSRWTYVPGLQVPRQPGDVMVEAWVREALVKLNPEIAGQPDRADEVIYALRAILLSVQADGLVRANENFMAWLRGEKTMPFGRNGEHVTIRLFDTTRLANNRFNVVNQWIYQAGAVNKRFDVVFVVNGFPLVIGEAKTPTRNAVTWFDGAYQVHEIYERQVPAMFVPNVFSFATEGKLYRYGSIRMPLEMWAPWRTRENEPEGSLADVQRTVENMLRPEVVLDIQQSFTLFATDKKHRRIKIICRWQQYFTTNQLVERVVNGAPKKGLIWHFQGSGKSLLMVFAAQKLRLHPKLGNPTVMIVVDRIDLDTQITATFNAADVPNMVGVADRKELQTLLGQDVRKVLITTIHKFAEAGGKLNERSNIIVMVDEAHRTQEGDLGRKMREALPNAFLFGLTGTPINRADKNTFWAFGADEDEKGYMSRYSFQESIRDKATLPLHFEAPEVKLKINKAAIDEAFKQITDRLSEQERDDLAARAAKMAVLVKNPERIRAVVNHIVKHFAEKVQPNGFKAQVVVFDRECCVLYKAMMDAVAHLKQNSEAGSVFRHVIIDEYQDTNPVQEQIFFNLARGHKNLCIVGDDDQALYRFRGATVENFVEFPARCQKYLGTEPQRIVLGTNYRSRKGIVTFFNGFIVHPSCDWRKQPTGAYRVMDKEIVAHRSDSNVAVVASTPAKPDDVATEVALLVRELIDARKVEDPSQIAFLFPSLKSPHVARMRDALADVGLEVYAPRAGQFLSVPEAAAVFGLLFQALGHNDHVHADFNNWLIATAARGHEVNPLTECRSST